MSKVLEIMQINKKFIENIYNDQIRNFDLFRKSTSQYDILLFVAIYLALKDNYIDIDQYLEKAAEWLKDKKERN